MEKPFSRYCCWSKTLLVWNVENVFSNMSASVIVSPHSFNFETILNRAELYSSTDLKSWILRFLQSYRAFGKSTVLWWSYLDFSYVQSSRRFSTVRYWSLRLSARWWRMIKIALYLSFSDDSLPSVIQAPRFLDFKMILVSSAHWR